MAKKATRRKKSNNSRRGSAKKTQEEKSYAWFSEVLSIVFVAIGVFILSSLISYSLISPSVADASISEVAKQNLMGPLGHMVAVFFKGFFGWGSLIAPLWFFLFATYFWIKARKPEVELKITSKAAFIAGVLGSSVIFSGLLYTHFGYEAGGNLGRLAASHLTTSFNTGGATLILGTLLLVFIALATQFSTGDIVHAFFQYLLVAIRFICISLPVTMYEYAVYAYEVSSEYIEDLIYRFRSEEEEDDDEPEVKKSKPKPKKRKNKVEVVEDSEIVVRRRQADIKAAAKNVKKIIKERKSSKVEESYPYEHPDISMLTKPKYTSTQTEDDKVLLEKSRLIEEKLRDFNISGKITEVHPGPVVTMFEFEPAAGVKVGKIASLQDDLSMSLKASAIRIIAPIPNKGTVGIEVPNVNRDIVRIREIIESEDFMAQDSSLNIAMGKDIYGNPAVVDVAKMPHLLIAGATGSGKSVCINTILLSLLYRCSPEELGLILIDPKMLELSVYEGIPHLKAPVVTVPKQAKAVLEWAVKEMNRRYRLMKDHQVRSIDAYNRMVQGVSEEEQNEKLEEQGVTPLAEDNILDEGIDILDGADELDLEDRIVEELKTLPKIVIVIDEMADLMLSIGRDIEDLVARLAQKARAAGIHLVLATQRPSVDVITGLIKANFPARISFRVSSRIDSRTILDSMGAEKLLGMGDSLIMLPGDHHLTRIHGAFVSDAEVSKVIGFLKEKSKAKYDAEILDYCEKAMEEDSSKGGASGDMEYDELYDQTLELIIEKGQASTSMIQRAFRIGYNRAARIMDTLEVEGIIGPMDGSRPREVLMGKGEIENRAE